MAIKDRISGLFKRGTRSGARKSATGNDLASGAIDPSLAKEEERQELLQQVGDGFTRVGTVLDNLDRHLQAGTRSLEGMTQSQNRLPNLIEGQRDLVERTVALTETNQQLLQTVQEQQQERQQAQEQMVAQLQAIGDGLKHLREHDRSQVELLLTFQRSGRRMVLLMGLIGVLVIIALLSLLLTMAIRPDLLGLQRQANHSGQPSEPNRGTHQAELPDQVTKPSQAENTVADQEPTTALVSDAINDAKQSLDPAIREFADNDSAPATDHPAPEVKDLD